MTRQQLLQTRLDARSSPSSRARTRVGEDIEGERNFFWATTSFMIVGGLIGLALIER